MICDHLVAFRARNPLYFKIISIYFKIISKLFHQIHAFGHRCLQKSIGDHLLMCFRKFWRLENRFWDIRFPIPAESARRIRPRPLKYSSRDLRTGEGHLANGPPHLQIQDHRIIELWAYQWSDTLHWVHRNCFGRSRTHSGSSDKKFWPPISSWDSKINGETTETLRRSLLGYFKSAYP